MSLTVAALRIVTVKALEHATSATHVYDSEVDPVDLIGDKAQPTTIVYADSGLIDCKDRALFEATHMVDLTLEHFIGRAVTVDAGEGQTAVQLQIPPTDAGYENFLRVLSYQSLKALTRRDGQSPWPGLWSDLWVRGSQDQMSHWDRGANADKGRRFAFLRHVLRLEVISDPVPGAPLPDVWERLLAAMAADAELAGTAALWRALVSTPAVPLWRQVQQQLGLTDAATAALGEAPVSGTRDDPLPASSEIAVALADEQGALTVDSDRASLAEDGRAAVTLAEG